MKINMQNYRKILRNNQNDKSLMQNAQKNVVLDTQF